MVKKVKRFVVFVLFAFFYSLLSSKETQAAPRVCLIPKAGDKLKYNEKATDMALSNIEDDPDFCY